MACTTRSRSRAPTQPERYPSRNTSALRHNTNESSTTTSKSWIHTVREPKENAAIGRQRIYRRRKINRHDSTASKIQKSHSWKDPIVADEITVRTYPDALNEQLDGRRDKIDCLMHKAINRYEDKVHLNECYAELQQLLTTNPTSG